MADGIESNPTTPATAPASPASPAAPATTPAAPVSTPTSAAPSTPTATPAATPPATAVAPTGGESAAELQRIAEAFGYRSPAEMRADLAFTRQFRTDVERSQQLRRQNDPEYQASRRRGEATRQLIEEGYGREAAEALAQLPEVTEYLKQVRANGATEDMVAELKALDIEFDDTPEGQELLGEWERQCASYLERDRRLNDLFFGSPAERRQAIREIVAREEKRINAVLRRQNATTLREHAARRNAVPRPGRSAAGTFVPREEKVTATDPLGRRRQGREIISRQLDDIFTHYGA